MDIAFRVDVSSHVGLGHYKRCLSLAKAFGEHHVSFFIKTDLLDLAVPYAHKFIPQSSELSGEVWSNKFDLVVVDFSHRFHYRDSEMVYHYLLNLRRIHAKIALIDGIAPDALYHRFTKPCFDILITPYFGAPSIQGEFIHLNSAKYFIFDPDEVKHVAEHVVRSQVANILLTTGGSDASSLTSRWLEQIETIHYYKRVTVIVGPGFSMRYVESLKKIALRSENRVTLVHSPLSLSPYYRDCDFCIATAGLTKYELALYGIPAILVSPTWDIFMANKAFAAAKVAISLGPLDLASNHQIVKHIVELIFNSNLRLELSSKSRSLIDGQGVFRLKHELLQAL